MSSLALAVAGAGYLTQWQQFNLATQELRALQANVKLPSVAMPLDKPAGQAPSDLSAFESASLMKSLNQIAGQIKLPLNEISYALDDNTSQPFLRYRVTLTVTSTYPVIRRFCVASLVRCAGTGDGHGHRTIAIPARQGGGRVCLSGEARDEAALAMFLEALSAQAALKNVHLVYQENKARDRLVTILFEIKATLSQ